MTPAPIPAKLLIGTDATFPPFESVDFSKRQIVGFDVDLMNAIAAKAGLQIEIVVPLTVYCWMRSPDVSWPPAYRPSRLRMT